MLKKFFLARPARLLDDKGGQGGGGGTGGTGDADKDKNKGGDGSNGTNADDIYKNLNLDAETVKLLKSNTALGGLVTHLLESKRGANDEAKKNREELEKIQKANDAATKKELEEKGKFKELYEAEKKKNEESAGKMKEILIKNQVSNYALMNGLQKIEYLKLFDFSKVETDNEFNVTNIEKVFNEFKKSNPELFGEPKKPGVYNGKPKPDGDQTEDVETLKKQAEKTKNPRDIAKYHVAMREQKKKKQGG
jgi:hypothetical protein